MTHLHVKVFYSIYKAMQFGMCYTTWLYKLYIGNGGVSTLEEELKAN